MMDSNHCLTQYMHNTFCWMNVWMGHNIMGYRILHWRYFFLSTLELPFTNLLASIIVIRNQPPVKLFLLTNLSFSSSCFKNLFLSPVFCSFIMICLSMDFFFSLILIDTYWGSSIWSSVSLHIRKELNHYHIKYFFYILSLFHSWNSN